jgi:AraC-like DNA-binding protein
LLEPDRIDQRITHVVRAIDGRHGRVSIDRLAANTGMTRRHLERQFLRQVGVSPKRLARIARFQRALRVLEDPDDPGPRGAVTAAACGYADQAHFVRDFRDLAGCPPTEHLLSRGLLTGFFTAKTQTGAPVNLGHRGAY